MSEENIQKHTKTGGDDLDDGLEYDQDLLASSDIDDEGFVDGFDIEANDEESVYIDDTAGLAVDEEKAFMDVASESKKRKVEQVKEEEGDDKEKADKKRRKKEKEKERKARKRQQNEPIPPSDTIPTHFSIDSLSALLLRSIKESFSSASDIELDEINIPQNNLLPPPSYSAPRLDPDNAFKPLQERIKDLIQKEPKGNGAPSVIILSLSGLRCADVVRGVRDVKGKGEVAKLFAKHFKLSDQVKYLKKTKVSIAVGTPARVGKLLAEDAIQITKDTVLLLDVGHQDRKTRTILTLPEVRDELWKSVFGHKTRQVLLDNGVRVGAF
ncbi:hypothetical protein L204_102358 [Cryptococcus depauperatus]|nr:protein CMS1 [Cryptococcus depauperatus CBS 7855]